VTELDRALEKINQSQLEKMEEMEFEGNTITPIQPPPLQDSKEYYMNTQRMSEAMIKNPKF
jgi:hypothetical protein